MKTTIYLIRHGQTEWNVQRRMQGRMDSPLTALGIEAAQQLAPEIPQTSAIYSSPAGRTVATSQILFGSQEVICDDRLLEIDMGNWEGRFQVDLAVEEPSLHADFWDAPHRYSKEDAETIAQVAERAIDFFQEIAERHKGEAVAIVSHTVVIRSILFSIDRRELADFWKPPAIYPASLSEVEVVGGVFRIVRFGCNAHHNHDHSGAY
jgi:probable phosphoglycerate mutase